MWLILIFSDQYWIIPLQNRFFTKLLTTGFCFFIIIHTEHYNPPPPREKKTSKTKQTNLELYKVLKSIPNRTSLRCCSFSFGNCLAKMWLNFENSSPASFSSHSFLTGLSKQKQSSYFINQNKTDEKYQIVFHLDIVTHNL